MGRDRQGVPVRRRRRDADPGRAIRRPLAADGLPLHVRAELPGGGPGQLVDRRWPGRPAAAPACPRRDPAACFPGAAGQASGVQAADGLEHSVDLGGEHRLQLRLRRIRRSGAAAPAWPRRGRAAAGRSPERGRGRNRHPRLPVGITAVSVFTLTSGAVYQTYATTWRGVEFLMNYYPILDRMPKGRDEGDAWQTWLRRHDEYDSR